MISWSSRTARYQCWLAAVTIILVITSVSLGQRTRRIPRRTQTRIPAPQTIPNATPTPLPQIERMEPSPAEVARGGAIIFRGQNFPSNPDDIAVFLNGTKIGAPRVVNPEKTMFVFAIPDRQPLGRYSVRVDFKVSNREVPFSPAIPPDGMLTVYSETGKSQLKINAVVPLVSYSEKEIYGFDIIGEGFSTRSSDNGLLLNHYEIPVCWADSVDYDECAKDETKVKGNVFSGQQIHVEGKIPKQFQGGAQVQVRVGQTYSPSFDVTLSRVSSIFPKLVAVGFVFVLFGLVLWLVSDGFRKVIARKRYSILSALFLDTETDTYSLSRLQFFTWTAVAILAYLYLVTSRSLVQGKLEFVDVPTGLPGIVMISAGTTVVAQAITRSKGPKGAGEIHPSLTDLVSTGGVIVPERFQFFVWTLIGAAVFVVLVFLNDPGTIKDLPQVPAGFLALMGVSSAGYLGGKAARSAGPVIDEIIAKVSSLELTIKGRILSKDASFRIGDDDVESDRIEQLTPEIIEPDDQGQPNTAKLLRVKIISPKTEWLKDDAKLTIVNPDGQKATWQYRVGPALTGPIQVSMDDSGVIFLKITGVNLSSKTKVTIESPEGIPFTQPIKSVFQDPNTIEITTKGLTSGVLVMLNPDQRSLRIPFG